LQSIPDTRKAVWTCFALLTGCLALSCGLKRPAGDVAATVDGERIFRADVEKYFQNQIAGSSQPLSDEQATSWRLNILEQLIKNEILMHRAGKLGLLATDEEVERKLNEIRSPYSSQEFAQRLRERKLSVEDFKHDISRALTADKVLHKEITSRINITAEDIRSYYNQHRAEFNMIEPRYHLAHIVVTTSADGQGHIPTKARNEGEARSKIQTVLTHLEAGEEFSRLAMTYSEDSATAPNGGDIGIVPESALKQTDAATRESVLKLKPGQHSPIIALANPNSRQTTGFQIVKLISLEPAGLRDLSDPRVEQEIRQQLQDRREQILQTAYYEVMRDRAKVENYYAEQLLDANGAAY
jgi:peptidyl-prolyl cis-trans isomerase SurA